MKTWAEKYADKVRREKAALARKAAKLSDPVYIVTPSEHGNGGWCGSSTEGVFNLKFALKIDPVARFHNGHYDPTFGSCIRICRDENPNHAIYIFNHEDRRREAGNGGGPKV